MSSGSPPPELTRITTRYIAAEDRVRLVGERAGGSEVAIWLTLRLLQRLVPKLLVHLEAMRGALEPNRELLLGFAQQNALAAHVPVAPVGPSAEAEFWLAERASIRRSTQALTITFESAEGGAASLYLPPVVLHQWLAILYRVYSSAQWPMDIWPVWLIENLEPVSQQRHVLH